MFIAVDGIDGAGKTTLVNQLADLLRQLDPVKTKEPTDKSEWGLSLRETATNGRMAKDKEIEFFHKDRLNHIKHVIQPALNSGQPVITDRYVDSTLAYQCHSPDEADILYEAFKSEILIPDITFILDCPVEIGLQRINRDRSGVTHFETSETLEVARQIFQSRKGPNYRHIVASGSAEHTFDEALKALLATFPNLKRSTTSNQKENSKRRLAC
jgi:dTMP kinase